MRSCKQITFAYTPDSDDAFYYDALENGRRTLPGFELRFRREPMSVLNRAALRGRYEVTAISSVLYPRVADRYAILSVGTSVGRGYGPVLVSREQRAIESLDEKRVGVPGIPTTGWFLLRLFCPGAVLVEMKFDEIGEAVAAGQLDAGVMIHEELLYYPQLGLKCVADLGAKWCDCYDLPLPVGLNLVRRDLGSRIMEQVCTAIRESLRYAQSHPQEALDRVRRFGRGAEGGCTEQFVSMFANEDSLAMPADVRSGLRLLMNQLVELEIAREVPVLDIVEGNRPTPVVRVA